MSFEVKYKILFELNIWNHFFLNKGQVHFFDLDEQTGEQSRQLSRYDVHQFFDLRPTASCLESLRNYKLLLKETASGWLVAVKVAEAANQNFEPALPFGDELKLSFSLKVIDPLFYNYTNLPLQVEKDSIYYFNNIIQPADYLIRLSPKTKDTTLLDYVSGNQFISMYQPLHDLEIAPNTTVTASVYDMIPGNPQPVLEKVLVNDENEAAQRQLDLRSLASGWYRLEGTGTSWDQSFYLNNDGFRGDTFGVIEIYGRNADDDHAVLDGNGYLRKPDQNPASDYLPARYELRFENRNTKWRYLNAENLQLCELGPFPLTRNGVIAVQCNGKTVPNPDARMIRQDGNQFISVIYI